MTRVLSMLIFGLFIGAVCGIALPQVPRTASGGYQNTTSIPSAATSTSASAAAPTALITSAATLPTPAVPSGWVRIPDTITFPCFLQNDCYEWTGTDLLPPPIPSTANLFGDAHLSQAAPWLVDPYHHINEYKSDYTYDSVCGLQWYSSLQAWMSTAPTALGPTVEASDIYDIVVGTTTERLQLTGSYLTIPIPYTTTWTGSGNPGELFTYSETGTFESLSTTWSSSYTVTDMVSGYTSLLSTRSAHRDTYWVSAFSYTPSEPCCSSCTVYGGTVQVMNWPTPAPEPPVSTLVDTKNNFTFISPSVYVAFESIYASHLCGIVGSEVYTSTTLSFAPGELSTSAIFTVYGPTSTTDWRDEGFTALSAFTETDCVPHTTTIFDLRGFATFTDRSDAMVYSATNTETLWYEGPLAVETPWAYNTLPDVITTYTLVHNPCSPALSVPTLLYSLQPLWTGCFPGISAFFDPPYTLTTGGPMSLITKTSPVPALPETGGPTATPGVAPKPGIPTPTPAPGNPDPKPSPNPPQDPPDPPPPSPHAPNPIQDPDPVPAPSAFIVAGQTLAQGAPPVTVGGHVVSLAPGLSGVVIDATKTVPLANFLANPTGAVAANPTNGVGPGSGGNGGGFETRPSPSGSAGQNGGAGGSASTGSGSGNANGNGSPGGGGGVGYVFGTQTLMPGSQITVSGEIMSLLPDGSSVVIIDPPTRTGSGSGSRAGTTKTEGISAFLGGSGSTSGTQTGTGGILHQTGKSGVVGRYTGHDRLIWVLGALGGLWILGLSVL